MSKTPKSDLLFAVGSALHGWSLVELQLATFFAELMGFDNDRRSHAIFGAIISLEVRLAICDRLVALQPLSELDKELWARISAKVRSLYKKRHAVAHFTLHSSRPELSPFLTTEKLITGEGISTLNREQVMDRAEKFIELRDAIKWFGPHVILTRVGKLEHRQAEREEPILIPRLRESARQILAERKERSRKRAQ